MASKLLIVCISILISFTVAGQVNNTELLKTENALRECFSELYKSENDRTSDSLNNLILQTFSDVLKIQDSFSYPWDSLNMIGKVHSTDQKINIYTWYIKQAKGNYVYYGFIQINTGGKKKIDIKVYSLSDKSKGMKNPEMQSLSADTWLGCVYFNMYLFTYKRVNYYTLLGYVFNNDFSNKKIIEVLTFNKKGDPLFGGEFQMDLQKVNRVILEYSAQVVATIKYDEKLQMIVTDHLSPFEPMFTGSYRFYGPDGSYDGYKFQKGTFILQKDVDARNLQ
jgi:hypothetical protein